jgi:hypothetical protein
MLMSSGFFYYLLRLFLLGNFLFGDFLLGYFFLCCFHGTTTFFTACHNQSFHKVNPSQPHSCGFRTETIVSSANRYELLYFNGRLIVVIHGITMFSNQ